jgi:hypothetical protein
VNKKKVVDVFFNEPGLSAYYLTLKAFRTMTCQLVRFQVMKRLLGDLYKRDSFSSLAAALDREMRMHHVSLKHYVVNECRQDQGGILCFHSEAFDAEIGGLINGGPYREMIWVNAAASLQDKQTPLSPEEKRRFDGAVPAEMPTTMTAQEAIEVSALVDRLVTASRTRGEKVGEAPIRHMGAYVPPITSVCVRAERDCVHTVSAPHVSGLAKDARFSGAIGSRRARESVVEIAWGSISLISPPYIPDAVINYRLGTEKEAVIEMLRNHGIRLDEETTQTKHRILRVITQALGPVTVLNQLTSWRAVFSVNVEAHKKKEAKHEAPPQTQHPPIVIFVSTDDGDEEGERRR